jgi:hypothetical protein
MVRDMREFSLLVFALSNLNYESGLREYRGVLAY